MTTHRRDIILQTNKTHLYRHFNNGICNINDLRIQPIEYINDNVHNSDSLRRHREDYWMKELKTIYPYGLNERSKNGDATKNIKMCIILLVKQKERENPKKMK